MVAINNSTVRQNLFETVYDTLKAHATSSSYGTSTQPTIVAQYVDDTKAMPEIVVHPANVDTGEWTFNRSNNQQNINLMVEVYTTKNKDVDVLSDDIYILLTTNKITGAMLIAHNETTSVSITNNNKIRNKVMNFTYQRR